MMLNIHEKITRCKSRACANNECAAEQKPFAKAVSTARFGYRQPQRKRYAGERRFRR